MKSYVLTFTLKSDAVFGRGDGVAGLLDHEVAHDRYGFPIFDGRSIKGLLTEECDRLLELLALLHPEQLPAAEAARKWMFGQPGSIKLASGALRFGPAQIPVNVRAAVIRSGMRPDEVLSSLTSIRKQTTMNAQTGAAQPHTLRAIRVILRETHFESQINVLRPLTKPELSLFAAGVLHWRRAGGQRNRGRGRLIASLLDDRRVDLTQNGLELLEVFS